MQYCSMKQTIAQPVGVGISCYVQVLRRSRYVIHHYIIDQMYSPDNRDHSKTQAQPVFGLANLALDKMLPC